LKLHADPTVVALVRARACLNVALANNPTWSPCYQNGEKAVNLAKTEDMRDLLQSCDPALGWAYRDGSAAWTEVPLSKGQQNAQASASAAAASAAAATAAAKVSPPPPPPPAPPAEVEAVDEAAAARILAVKLSQAAYFGNASEVRALLAAGADATTTDGCGMTALHWVASRGTGETARVLCAAGALVNCRSNDGWTPLHLAALAGRADVVKVLLELGAEATAVNNQGRTPLQMSESQSVRDLLALSDPSAAAPAPPPLPAAPAPAPPLRQAHAPASFLTAAALGEKALSDEMERLRLKKSAAAAAGAAGKAAPPPQPASSGSLGDSAAAAYRAAADFAGLQ